MVNITYSIESRVTIVCISCKPIFVVCWVHSYIAFILLAKFRLIMRSRIWKLTYFNIHHIIASSLKNKPYTNKSAVLSPSTIEKTSQTTNIHDTDNIFNWSMYYLPRRLFFIGLNISPSVVSVGLSFKKTLSSSIYISRMWCVRFRACACVKRIHTHSHTCTQECKANSCVWSMRETSGLLRRYIYINIV